MTDHPLTTAFHDRFTELEHEIESLKNRAGLTGNRPVADHHRQHLERIDAQRRKLRRLLEEKRETDWELAKEELEREWTILLGAFQHWSERVDKEFGAKD